MTSTFAFVVINIRDLRVTISEPELKQFVVCNGLWKRQEIGIARINALRLSDCKEQVSYSLFLRQHESTKDILLVSSPPIKTHHENYKDTILTL